jgi:hypothetical protein
MKIAIALLAVLAACAPAPKLTAPGPAEPSGEGTQFCFSNQLAAYGVMRVRAGNVSMRIEENRELCRYLDGTGYARVVGSSIGGGALGQFVIDDVVPLDSGCWRWTVYNGAPGFPLPCEIDDSAFSQAIIIDRAGMVRITIDESWFGFTMCGTVPRAYVRADIMLTEDGPQLMFHELDHARLMATFESCDAFREWAKQPGNAALMEASAYCVSAKVDTLRNRLTWDNAIRMYSARLAHTYPFGLSETEAEALIRRFCHEEPTRE